VAHVVTDEFSFCAELAELLGKLLPGLAVAA